MRSESSLSQQVWIIQFRNLFLCNFFFDIQIINSFGSVQIIKCLGTRALCSGRCYCTVELPIHQPSIESKLNYINLSPLFCSCVRPYSQHCSRHFLNFTWRKACEEDHTDVQWRKLPTMGLQRNLVAGWESHWRILYPFRWLWSLPDLATKPLLVPQNMFITLELIVKEIPVWNRGVRGRYN